MALHNALLVNLHAGIELECALFLSPCHCLRGKDGEFFLALVGRFVKIPEDGEIDTFWRDVDENHVLRSFPRNLAQLVLKTGGRGTLVGGLDFHWNIQNLSISLSSPNLFCLCAVTGRTDACRRADLIQKRFTHIPNIVALKLHKVLVRAILPNVVRLLLLGLRLDDAEKKIVCGFRGRLGHFGLW